MNKSTNRKEEKKKQNYSTLKIILTPSDFKSVTADRNVFTKSWPYLYKKKRFKLKRISELKEFYIK